MTSDKRKNMYIESAIKHLCNEAKRIADEHGFTDATIPEDIALMHSELSELLEEYRAHKPMNSIRYTGPRDMGPGKPEGPAIECADIAIRLFHFCAKHQIDLGEAIAIKMTYNDLRPFKHGDKKI